MCTVVLAFLSRYRPISVAVPSRPRPHTVPFSMGRRYLNATHRSRKKDAVDVIRVVQRRVYHRRFNHLRMDYPFIGWMYMRTLHRKVVSKRMPNEECVLSGWFIKGSIIYRGGTER